MPGLEQLTEHFATSSKVSAADEADMVDAILFAAHMAVGCEIVVVVVVSRVPRIEAQLQPLKLKLKKVRPTPSGPTVPCSPAHSTGPSQRNARSSLQSRPGPL